MLFVNDLFTLDAVSDSRLVVVLRDASDQSGHPVRCCDLIAAAIRHGDRGLHARLSQTLQPGRSLADNGCGPSSSTELSREEFDVMTLPPANPEDHASQPRPCNVFSYDFQTGEHTVTHLPEPPNVIVQLDDGTRLPLDEYLALRDQSQTPGAG